MIPYTNVSLNSIQTELGGSNPISINEYYRGGSIVHINQTSPSGTIPTSGQIDIAVFRGVVKYVALPAITLSMYDSGGFVQYTDPDTGDVITDYNNSIYGYVEPYPGNGGTGSLTPVSSSLWTGNITILASFYDLNTNPVGYGAINVQMYFNTAQSYTGRYQVSHTAIANVLILSRYDATTWALNTNVNFFRGYGNISVTITKLD